MVLLNIGVGSLAPLEQCVTTQGNDDPHGRGVSPDAAKRGHHDRLDGVKAVLGLVEDDGRRRLEHLVGDLEGGQSELLVDHLAQFGVAIMHGREAVHEFRVRVAGQRHHVS